MIKKIIKTTGIILLILIAAFALLTAGLAVWNGIKTKSEEKMLTEKGYMNLVSAGDYRLNVCSYGSETPEHTIVGISGKGVSSYSLAARGVTDRFSEKNRIVFIDRAGYGLSDDTAVPQTLKQVVSDYRAALKNAGFEPPYILMPHSLGGVYATYWESAYPEEIEALILLDCSQLGDDKNTFEFNVTFFDTFEAIMCKTGWQRLLLRVLDKQSFYEAPEEFSYINEALLYRNGYSLAMVSEAKLANENCYNAFHSIVKNDIPKLYISSHPRTKEEFLGSLEIMNELQRKIGGKEFTPPDNIDIFIEEYNKFDDETTVPYVEALGNCELRYVNGTHMLYVHRPKETADVIERFLDKL